MHRDKHRGGHGPGEHPHRHPLHHHRHPHEHHGHPRHGLNRMQAFLRHIQEIVAMGASEAEVHDVIDYYVSDADKGDAALAARDPGRGTDETPVSAVARARAIADACHEVEDAWHASLRSKSVVVAGEFPPHIIEGLLVDGVNITQIHPPHEGGYAPPHFHHLAPFGLRGLTNLHDLAEVHCDVLLVHGAPDGDEVIVSTIVPIVLRMFPAAERHLLLDDHVAPHMMMRVAHHGFRNISAAL